MTVQDQSTAELLGDVLASALLDVHTALPGIVKSYDAATLTAKVQPAVKRILDGELETLPLIPNVPVAWPAAGGFLFHLPLEAGDTVMLVFSEAAWAEFRSTGQVSAPKDSMRHSLSYPIALPFSRTKLTPAPAGAHVVTPEPLTVAPAAGAATAQFCVVETKLITWLASHVHTSAAPSNPTSPPVTPPLPGTLSSPYLKAGI